MSLLTSTIGELLEEKVDERPNHEAVVYPEKGIRWTYQEFDEKVNETAKALMALGVEKGEHIAIWADNKPEWVLTQFATGKMGAVLVTVNTSYQAAELEYLLNQSDTTTLILAENFKGTSYVDIVNEVAPELKNSEPGQLNSDKVPKLKRVIVLGEKQIAGCYTWDELLQKAKDVSDEDLRKRKESLHHDDIINMQYTSGTTGFPKGVMLTHYNIVNNGKQVAEGMNFTGEDRLCVPVPLFHCFGCVMSTLATVSKGGTMVMIEQYNPEVVLQAVQDEKCTALHGVPTMFIGELNNPEFDQFDLSSIRTGIMAGSNCPKEVMNDVIHKMGASEVTICYGQTETSPVFTQTRPTDSIEIRTTSVGKVHPNVEAKIVEPGTNQTLPPNEPGEIVTRGYHVMAGYYKNEEETNATIDEDGWLHTGDIGIMDEDGYFQVTGRMKDMVIRGGENIYPREIEEFIITHPDVLDVQVVGVPDPKYGEELMAWIIPKEGANLTEENIKSFCKGKISHYKIPKYIELTEEYPMTASGKVQKYRLREQAKDLIQID